MERQNQQSKGGLNGQDKWLGHRMPENPVVGMVGFLLGHGLNNGVGQRRKTSSIAVSLAVLENSALTNPA